MTEIKRILIVEDDADIRNMYLRTLEPTGKYELKVADTGDKALTAVTDFKPDLILLDIMIPGATGLEILKKLRTDPAYGAIKTPIIMMTNMEDPQVSNDAKANGANDYVIKTNLMPKDLLKLIADTQANN